MVAPKSKEESVAMYESLIADFAKAEEKQKGLQKMEDYRDRLLDSMTSEQKHLLEEYKNHVSEITSQTECEIFIDGFRFGVRLAFELLETQN